MRNFLYRMQNALARFMYGRNGIDQLNQALFILFLVVWGGQLVLRIIFKSHLLDALLNMAALAVALYYMFRSFSKNLEKRRAENQRYLNWAGPRKAAAAARKARKQDKDHKYFTCSKCKTVLRVPVGKGEIEITCPKCGAKIRGKS